MKAKKEFTSKGLVYGNLWGGGRGAYSARRLTSDTFDGIIKQANGGLAGSLDDGMGYESLIGAALIITEISTIFKDGKEYKHYDASLHFVGNLTPEDKDFLEDYVYNL